MVENIIWIKIRIRNCVSLNKINSKLNSTADDLVTTCDEIMQAVAKSYNEPTKAALINFNEKRHFVK